ncbi:MAG: hypothetical protein HYR96_06715 [Deltaproteobacteria bacterium]|nr:hypothetical protein [Deltaproteobacteria bacterium]MBI3296446.1 hypothetical protein [Deltaproteobacteria bacterium]
MKGLLMALTMAGTTVMAGQNYTLEKLAHMDQTELNTLYAQSSTGIAPTTDTRGKAVFFPGSFLATPTTVLASLIWQGKTFSSDGTVLMNKVFGFHAIKAKVYRGTSLFDGREATIVDYSETSLVAGWVRDEIREVSPGVYLGRAYARTFLGPYFLLNFALSTH